MSKQTVFKKVYVKDRLPKKLRYVATVNTLGGIDTLYHIGNGEFTNTHVSVETLDYIEAWLEEIELPSEEEIEKLKPLDNSIVGIYDSGYYNGVNYILNKLK